MVTEIIPKRCPHCKQSKQLSEFSKDRSAKDGLKCCCKSCRKAEQQQYQQTPNGKAVFRKGTDKYRQTLNGKACRKAYRQSENGKAAIKRFYARNPNYAKATNAVNRAIKCGRLPRPESLLCHYCPNPAQEYHHWHGYEPEHWLDVVPACRACHGKEHRKSSSSVPF